MTNRRVGSVTLGLALVGFGVLFCLHTFLNIISYAWIFRLWPLMLVCLGIEVLFSLRKQQEGCVYDKAAVFLLICLTLFCLGMACADHLFSLFRTEWSNYISFYS